MDGPADLARRGVGDVDRAGDDEASVAAGVELDRSSPAGNRPVDSDRAAGGHQAVAAQVDLPGEIQRVVGVAANDQVGAQVAVHPVDVDRVAPSTRQVGLDDERLAGSGERHRRAARGRNRRQAIAEIAVVGDRDGLGRRGELEDELIGGGGVDDRFHAGVGEPGGAGRVVPRPGHVEEAVADAVEPVSDGVDRRAEGTAFAEHAVLPAVHSVEGQSPGSKRVAAGEVDDQGVAVAGAVERDVFEVLQGRDVHFLAVDRDVDLVSLSNDVEGVRQAIVGQRPGVDRGLFGALVPRQRRPVEHAPVFEPPDEQVGEELVVVATGRGLAHVAWASSEQSLEPSHDSHSISSPQ